MNVIEAFQLLRAKRAVNYEGYNFKYDTYFDGHATLHHMVCMDVETNKGIWHIWGMEGRNWTPDDLRRSNMNRMFSITEMCSYGDFVFYDPMGLIHFPGGAQPAGAVLNSYNQGRGLVRQHVCGTPINVHPGWMRPGDSPFHPGPGMPGLFQWHDPQMIRPGFGQQTQYSSGTGQRSSNFGTAEGLLHTLLGVQGVADYNQVRRDLFAKLVDANSWTFDIDDNKDPVMTFSYSDSHLAKGVQQVIRKLLKNSLVDKGYTVTPTATASDTVLEISVNLRTI